MYVFVWREGLWGHVLHISHARCMSAMIVLLSVTVKLGASQRGQNPDGEPGPPVSRVD